MSVSTENNRMSVFTTNSIVEDFDFDLLIHSTSELQVWYRLDAGNYALLVLNTDYGVVFNEQGGTVSTNGYTAPLAAGTLLIIRHIDLTQQTNWRYNDSHTGGQHQNDFDRSTMRDLQQQEELDRSPKFAIHSGTVDITFPEPVANMILGWNAGGTDLTNMSPITIAVLIAEEIIAGSVPEELTDLTDVTITTPASGDLLRYDGSLWLNDPYTNIDHDQLTNFAANEHFTEVSIDHVNIQSIGTNTHAQIDTHLALANEHIDWTGSTEDLLTTGSGTFDELTITGNAGFISSSIIFQSLEGDSTSFFTVVALDGTPVFNVDTTNERVGIKTVTPSYLLDVNGVSAGTSFITASDIGVAGDTDLLQLAANALTVNGTTTATGLTITNSAVLGSDSAVFQPNADSTTFFQISDADGGTPILNVDSTNERVGIGTTAPDSIFHIKANFPGVVGSDYAGQIIIQNPANSVFSNAVITGYESDGDGNPDQQLWYLGSSSVGNSDIIFLNRRNSKLQLGTNGVSQLTILGDGNVGIGTNAPSTILEIAQSADSAGLKVVGFDDRNDKNVELFVDANGFSWINGTSVTMIGVGGVYKFLVTPTDINVYDRWRFRVDNDELIFGAGDDCSITYNGTNMIINPKKAGTGYVSILGDIRPVNIYASGRASASEQGLPSSAVGTSAGNIYWDDNTRLLYVYSDNSAFGFGHFIQPSGGVDEITATSEGVAADITTMNTEVTTNGDSDLDNVTLANGISGQVKHIYCVVEGNAADTWKITPATMCGGTQITFSGVGEGCTLVYADNEGWVLVGNNGGTIS